jgi:hypothetical protein
MTENEPNSETDEELMNKLTKNIPSKQCKLLVPSHPFQLSRNELLEFNASVILLLTQRLQGNRFRPRQGDAIRLGYIRSLIQALQSYNEILKGCELEELERKVAVLEQGRL